MENCKKAYGWNPGLPDKRDFKYSVVHKVPHLNLPTAVNLQNLCPPVYDQGDISSCTANAIAALLECLQKKEKHPVYVPSRLFIYYNERQIEGDVNDDSGAVITDGMRVVQKLGAPHENLWWYNTKKFAAKPSKNVYEDAAKHKLGAYSKLDNTNLDELRNCLASGYPFVFGFTAYQSFEGDAIAKNGFLTMPATNEKVIGGHAVMAVGYDIRTQCFLVRNSWGPSWGLKGYFWMPFGYIQDPDLCADFWTARLAG